MEGGAPAGSFLITGTTGQLGHALLRRALLSGMAARTIVFSRDERKQAELRHALARECGDVDLGRLRFFLGDVRDRARLDLAFRGVDVIIHAAALSDAAAAEYNPSESIATNILGAENVVWASLANGVKQVVAISTHEACSPANLHGATRLAAEKIFVAANNLSGDLGARFSVLRLPAFSNEVIPAGAVTRFDLCVGEAADLALWTAACMRGGEIFVPKAPSVLVAEPRPGDGRPHQVLVSPDEARTTRDLGSVFVVEPQFVEWRRRSLSEDGLGVAMPETFCFSSRSALEAINLDGSASLTGYA